MKIAPVQDTSSVTFRQKAQELPCEMEKRKLLRLCSLCVCLEIRNPQNELKKTGFGMV